ncbi:hypothetical protein H2201_008700 [Coniosporium apollinis]|uniref:Peptidase metallopeptidase domain-containing protein n=1 Tax=Coniosporium apollinis TaxID=61459 RepID=A0ABQ9NGA4_9PEZI|nr:hypothetical protein H2201_008700 [Coniosporium apollinis]
MNYMIPLETIVQSIKDRTSSEEVRLPTLLESLRITVEYNNKEMFQRLVDAGTCETLLGEKVSQVQIDDYTEVLIWAAGNGLIHEVSELLEAYTFSMRHDNDLLARASGRLLAAAAGVSPPAETHRSRTVPRATAEGRHLDVVGKLLAPGVRLDRSKICQVPYDLKDGEEHEGVCEAKKYLKYYGYAASDAFTVDNKLDSETRKAISQFQEWFELDQTGQLDGPTKAAMTQTRCAHRDGNLLIFGIIGPWHKRDLKYMFGSTTLDLDPNVCRAAVQRAFQTWADAGVSLTFTEVSNIYEADICIDWRNAADPDLASLDPEMMMGPTLAHADFPPGHSIIAKEREPLPLHFDDSEHVWVDGAVPNGYDIETVALHEIGHCLGMLHSNPCFRQLVFATLLLLLSGVVSQQVVLDNIDHPNVTIEGVGPSHADLNESVAQALNMCQVRAFLNGTRHRLLFSEFQSEPLCHSKHTYDRYSAAAYDYTHGRAIFVNGIPFDSTTVSATEANVQPFSNAEELAEAARIAGARSDEVVSWGMPPFISRDFPNGTSHRILNIAINSGNSSNSVYVNMNNGTVESPPDPLKETLACEAPPPARASAIDKGVPGTANLIITQAGRELWTFRAIRPSASSGNKGLGIELRNVKYKGKTLLFQAHVPILNVEYERQNTGCGPYYRDWQYQEWPLQCSGRDIAPGFRLCSSPAKSILDPPHADGGNFAGAAVYVEGLEVVLKAQMIAGWLDFDIVSAGNNIVREFNEPPIGTSNYHDKSYEIRRQKDRSRHRHWEISNTRTGSTYSLIPGPNDGTGDAFGVGDLWVLRYHSNELDDGVPLWVIEGSAADTRANIDKFVNGEPTKDKDVVVWLLL